MPQVVDGIRRICSIVRPVLPNPELLWGTRGVKNPFGSETHLKLPAAKFQNINDMSDEERTVTRSISVCQLLGGRYIEQDKVTDFLGVGHPGRPVRTRDQSNTEGGVSTRHSGRPVRARDQSNNDGEVSDEPNPTQVEQDPTNDQNPIPVTPSTNDRRNGQIRRIQDISSGTVVVNDSRRKSRNRRRLVFERDNNYGECSAMKNWDGSDHNGNLPHFNIKPVLIQNGTVVTDTFEDFIEVRCVLLNPCCHIYSI